MTLCKRPIWPTKKTIEEGRMIPSDLILQSLNKTVIHGGRDSLLRKK